MKPHFPNAQNVIQFERSQIQFKNGMKLMPTSIWMVQLNYWNENVLFACWCSISAPTIYYERAKASEKKVCKTLDRLVFVICFIGKRKMIYGKAIWPNTLKFIHWKHCAHIFVESGEMESANSRTHFQAIFNWWMSCDRWKLVQLASNLESTPAREDEIARDRERESEREKIGWKQEHNCRAQVKALS